MDVLEQVYWAFLGSDGQARLSHDLQLEDERQEFVEELLRRADASPELEAFYSDWNAFSGGGQNLANALVAASSMVAWASNLTPAGVPSFITRLWPSRGFDARTCSTPYDPIVFVNTGLLVGVRQLLQAVAESTEAILGVEFAGGDHKTPRETTDELSAMLDRYLRGGDLRDHERVILIQGPREVLRREAMFGAICYVIAHEAGHLARNRPCAGGWCDDNQAFQEGAIVDDPKQLSRTVDEVHVVRASSREYLADIIAAWILHQLPAEVAGQPDGTLIVGAMAVLALQTAVWWRRAAYTDESLGWTHPFPEGRMWGLGQLLGQPSSVLESDDPKLIGQRYQMQQVASLFCRWCMDALGVPECKKIVRERKGGLANRGLNPVTLAAIYASDPSMPKQPSDILAELSRRPGNE